MNLKKIFLLSILVPSCAQPMMVSTQHKTPLAKLWIGIQSSNVRLVKQALAEGVDTQAQFGRYGDTPLMAALRIYGRTLTTHKDNNKKDSLRSALGFSAACATYFLLPLLLSSTLFKKLGLSKSNAGNTAASTPGNAANPAATTPESYTQARAPREEVGVAVSTAGVRHSYYIYQNTFLLPMAMSGAFFLASNIPLKSNHAATIVELLIKAEKNIGQRNKEGITALDVLNAYFPYAYQAQDASWSKFLYLLHEKLNGH